MNNYYSLHHLSEFMDKSLRGATIISAISRKKRLLEINLESGGRDHQLVFHTANPSALFLQDGVNDSRVNAALFFEEVYGKTIRRVNLDENDRIVTFGIDDGFELQVVAFGPTANAFLNHDGNIVGQFRNANKPPTRAPYERGSVESVAKANSARERVLLRDPRFPRQLIDKLAQTLGLGQLDAAELCMMVDGLVDTMLTNPVYRRLSDNSICLLGDDKVPDDGATVFEDINSLVRACWVQREIRDKFASRRSQLASEMEASERRLCSLIEGLEDDSKSTARAEHYEIMGHILMAHSYLDIPESDVVELDDIYNPGSRVKIKVKGGLTLAESAQQYYQKSKNTRKSTNANLERLEDARHKLAQLHELQRSFMDVDGPRSLDRWLKTHDKTLAPLIPTRRSDAGSARPWRVQHIGKYEIWIGKSSSGNDELLQAAHKEDLWMHARHVSGSHVIVRMNRSPELPPLDIIETAASWAAWYSKAKTSGMAPVVYTKRKYVRKPKGAAPGTALVDKEQVCLVEPTKPPNSIAE